MPLMRRTAAPWPGPATVFAWTWQSYCSKTQRRLARFAPPRSARSTAPGSIPRSGQAGAGSIGAPGAGAARRRAGGVASRSWTIASLVSAAAGIRASSRRRRGRPSASRPPSTTAMSPSAVTRPMIATGRPQRSQTSRDLLASVRPDDREHPLLATPRSSPRTAPCPARAAGSRRGRPGSRSRPGRPSRTSRR